ncbi:right-handed parallel beta-helix repeat-containing protein [bacterium]|nr:right-handed parallel beta-helix repeat-containing protein [bacterium]
MFLILVFIAFFTFSCGVAPEKGDNIPVENEEPDEFPDEESEVCAENTVAYRKPEPPGKPEIAEIRKYDKNFDCLPLPEPENGELILGDGCFSGCIKAETRLRISGNGAGNTMIVCDDEENQAVVEVLPNAEFSLEDISLSGRVRCIFAGNGSSTTVKKSVLSHCMKGGINICPDEAGCRADLSVSESFIGDIDEAASGISYGISFGNGYLSVSGSEISGVNSFGIAVWGESGNNNRIIVENSVISGVYGGLRSYEGLGFYAENSADITIKNSSVSDAATSFVLVSSDSDEINLKLVDFSAENILETSEEQGGIVLDGRVNGCFERVSVKTSRGNGIFSLGAVLYAEDLTVESVFSDGLGENGFALQLVDGSESFIKRLSVISAEKAGVLLDGGCSAEIEDFEIVSTKSDVYSGEFGVGAAIQNGAAAVLKNGILSENRETGVLAVSAEISLENVEIRNTLPRRCTELGNCVFAPKTDFGHGISLYFSSLLRFDSMTLFNNNNGLNIAASEVRSFGSKKMFFGNNTTAVNAWNINDLSALEESLSNSSFCGNASVFTSDSQPVRDAL